MSAGPRHMFQSRLAGGSETGLKPMLAARLAAVAVGDLQLAELARLGSLHAGRPTLASLRRLGAVLNDDAVFLLGFDRHAAFADVVAHGFFDVNVLAGLGGPNGDQRVPVVGRGDGNRIDVFVVERPADVVDAFGFVLAFGPFGDAVHRPAQHVFIHVGQIGDFDVVLAEPTADVGPAAAVQARDGDADAVVGPLDVSRGAGSR